ncbi:MAG: DUF5679 domain-containing protein [Anaerolineae bacterium]
MWRFLVGAVVGFILGWALRWYLTEEETSPGLPLTEREGVTVGERPPEETAGTEVLAYCPRCRAKRPMLEPQSVMSKDGRPALKGSCAVCGGGLFRFVKG